jgi:hypothetical protein
MKKIVLRSFLLIMLFVRSTICTSAQEKHPVKVTFPQSFIGEWRGSLLYYKSNNTTDTVAMELNILPTKASSEYYWQIIYGANKNDNRPYILKPVDSIAGKWIIDENNGIRLNGVFKGNRFMGAFAVGGNVIVDSYYLQGNELHIDFYSFKQEPTGKTGNSTEDSPNVDLFDIRSFQKAVLTRKP